MCGIVFIDKRNGKKASGQAIDAYKKQDERGSEGFGFVEMDDAWDILHITRFQNEKEALEALEKTKGTKILFHHRYPTSTINIEEANHPIEIKGGGLKYVYYIVHNGVISNDYELKQAHEKLGFEYSTLLRNITATRSRKIEQVSWNDSEALGVELALWIEGKKDKVETKGSVAFIMLQVDGKRVKKIFFGRNSASPLLFERQKNTLMVSSKNLSKGSANLEPNTIAIYDTLTNKTELKTLQLACSSYYDSSMWDTEIGFTRKIASDEISEDIDDEVEEFEEEIDRLTEEYNALDLKIGNAILSGNYKLERKLTNKQEDIVIKLEDVKGSIKTMREYYGIK